MIEVPHINFKEHVELIGTAHFTKRSISEAYVAIKSTKTTDIALELDWERFIRLNAACSNCTKRMICKGLCEFTVVADAIGNVDANIWLIDIAQQELKQRIRRDMNFGTPRMNFFLRHYLDEDLTRLWETGQKERVVEATERYMDALRGVSPSIPRVLIDERNTIMAARLAWIVSKNMDDQKKSKILAFVGAAHVKGIKELLKYPILIRENLRQLNLQFTKPILVRRVAVQES